MPGLNQLLCGNFLGRFHDQHESPPASDEDEQSDRDLMPRDYNPAQKTAVRFTRLGNNWVQYRTPIVVESRVGKELIRRQFDGIRVQRREVPPGMAQKLAAVSVHTVEIIQCKMKEEPPLSEMHDVVVLRLSRNELTRLSRAKQSEKPYRLETLVCDRNKLQVLEPGALAGSLVASLQVLDLSRNQLAFLPGDFAQNARQLRYLDLSHNQLFALPDSILECSKLLVLNVNNNELEKLPDGLGELKGLRKLSASFNALTALPETLGECRLLEKIRVVSNSITVMPHSLLQLWKQQGGVLEELLVDGNPLIQPSITAFQMGGLDRAMSLFGEWVRMESEVASEIHSDMPRTLGGAVSVFEDAEIFETDLDEEAAPTPARGRLDSQNLNLEELDLEVVQVIDDSGKRVSKLQMSQSDLQRLQEGSSKNGVAPGVPDLYYFSHTQGDIHEILAIRSAESTLLLLKKRSFVVKQRAIAIQLASEVADAETLKKDYTPELWQLLQANFDVVKYTGKVPVQDIDLYFCTLVYGSKTAFTSIHALWDKFEVGEKGYMTKDEWFNLCTRVRTKLPLHIQEEIWDLLTWRNKTQLAKCDFVAGWHSHDLEVRDAHLRAMAEVMKLEYYSMSLDELQARIRTRLAEDSETANFSGKTKAKILLPPGEGERRARGHRA